MIEDTGNFESTLDDKGRISIPKALRERYTGNLVITQGSQSCAWIMTPAAWEVVSAKLLDRRALTEDERELIEYWYIIPKQIVEVDAVGRIAVPSSIRKYAGLEKDCLVLNAQNRLELWNAQAYYGYLQENRSRMAEIRQKMNLGGSEGLFHIG